MAPRAVLVLNAGSSSLKYSLFRISQGLQLAVHGLVEQIGTPHGAISHKVVDTNETISEKEQYPDHKIALERVVELLTRTKSEANNIAAVGHRVVHGGESLTAPSLVTEAVKKAIEDASPLAPLHNPPNLQGIRVAEELFDCPQVAVFDTAFHSSMPPHVFTYGIPYKLRKEIGIRKYGFHGTSYAYLLPQAAEMVGKRPEETNLIVMHLGAGASIAAIKEGKCLDTSMGVTPLEGLVMATRCGDIDPSVSKILHDLWQYKPAQVDDLFNKKSGLFGICGEKDMKTIVEKAKAGDELHKLALDVFVHRVRKYLGAYLVHLGGRVDAVVFSAGIGERAHVVRSLICQDLDYFGIALDEQKNAEVRKERREIQSSTSRIKVLVIPTNEELQIAKETIEVVNSANKPSRAAGG